MIVLSALFLSLFSATFCGSNDAITCPCGATGVTVTAFPDEYFREDPCYKFQNCEECSEKLVRCLSCPKGYYGTFCMKREDMIELEMKADGYCQLQMNDVGKYNCTKRPDGTTCDVLCFGDRSTTRYSCMPDAGWSPELPKCVKPKVSNNADVTQGCTCQNGGRCNRRTRRCICSEQFTGEFCELERVNVEEAPVCKCQNGGKCSPTTRSCMCPAGFHGEFCEHRVRDADVTPVCKCQNGGKCPSSSGRCICFEPYHGEYCEHVSHKADATPVCKCQNGGRCHARTGKCMCSDQFRGEFCEHGHHHNERVTSVCKCQNGGRCHSGKCLCSGRYGGEFCELVHRHHNADVTEVCKCQNGGRCDSVTARCICSEAFRGDFCEYDTELRPLRANPPNSDAIYEHRLTETVRAYERTRTVLTRRFGNRSEEAPGAELPGDGQGLPPGKS